MLSGSDIFLASASEWKSWHDHDTHIGSCHTEFDVKPGYCSCSLGAWTPVWFKAVFLEDEPNDVHGNYFRGCDYDGNCFSLLNRLNRRIFDLFCMQRLVIRLIIVSSLLHFCFIYPGLYIPLFTMFADTIWATRSRVENAPLLNIWLHIPQ